MAMNVSVPCCEMTPGAIAILPRQWVSRRHLDRSTIPQCKPGSGLRVGSGKAGVPQVW